MRRMGRFVWELRLEFFRFGWNSIESTENAFFGFKNFWNWRSIGSQISRNNDAEWVLGSTLLPGDDPARVSKYAKSASVFNSVLYAEMFTSQRKTLYIFLFYDQQLFDSKYSEGRSSECADEESIENVQCMSAYAARRAFTLCAILLDFKSVHMVILPFEMFLCVCECVSVHCAVCHDVNELINDVVSKAKENFHRLNTVHPHNTST